jgi:hypothetical protein
MKNEPPTPSFMETTKLREGVDSEEEKVVGQKCSLIGVASKVLGNCIVEEMRLYNGTTSSTLDFLLTKSHVI